MIKRSARSVMATWFAGLLALLPLLLTVSLLGWVVNILDRFLGPSSFAGQLFAMLGQPISMLIPEVIGLSKMSFDKKQGSPKLLLVDCS